MRLVLGSSFADPLVTYNNSSGEPKKLLKKKVMTSSKVHRICDNFASIIRLKKKG